jgi:hypothetical protein
LENSLLALQGIIRVAVTVGGHRGDLPAFVRRRRDGAEATGAADQQVAQKNNDASTYVKLVPTKKVRAMAVSRDSDKAGAKDVLAKDDRSRGSTGNSRMTAITTRSSTARAARYST